MQGDIVKAAKWLGGCMIAASLILVIGFHPTFTGRVLSFTKVQPEMGGPQPVMLPQTAVYSTSIRGPVANPSESSPGENVPTY